MVKVDFPGGSVVKNLPANGGATGSYLGFDPLVGKILQKENGNPTPVFLHGKSNVQRNLVGYRAWGLQKELDLT